MKNKSFQSATAQTSPDGLASSDRRTCLKLVTGAAVGAGTFSALPTAASPATLLSLMSSVDASAATHEPGFVDSNPVLPNLTINININRGDLPDWMLIENMREEPLVLKQFSPQWLVYNEKLLDLNAMLSRQQRGRNQLEIWPNYAWNHSVRGAVRSLQECGTLPDTCFDASPLSKAALQAGHQSVQLPALVDATGVVTLLNT